MPKLPRLTAKELKRMLEKKGFFLARQNGSHMIYRNKEGVRVTLPFHSSKQLHPKIVKQILRDAKISL